MKCPTEKKRQTTVDKTLHRNVKIRHHHNLMIN